MSNKENFNQSNKSGRKQSSSAQNEGKQLIGYSLKHSVNIDSKPLKDVGPRNFHSSDEKN
ncbi:MAG: hypothetical protein J1E61_05645 [Lachnospiraceae bacterium]|nr:hypothetical protein [Lachnospiraceae bacterium]